jgi:dimethylargininase
VTVALVRPTSSLLADGLLTHVERIPVDIDLARRQWATYVEALQSFGWQVHRVEGLESCPDSVFIEDTVVMIGEVAVIARPGHETRRPEVEAIEPVTRALGCRIERILEPGTLDGGDVLKVRDTIYVGLGGRTNAEGIRQLTHIAEPLGARVVTVPVTKALHLKSAVTALPDGTVIGWDPIVDNPTVFPSYRSMPEESGAHVVVIDDRRLLMAADAPRSAELLETLGYEVTQVDISEFIKLEGCVTCLSVRLRHH